LESFGRSRHFIAAVIFYQQYSKTKIGRENIDRLSLKMPLFGDLIKKISGSSF
jgi:type IV pilus assembly protein PilC